MDDNLRYQQGIARRREVLGDAYVDRALAAKTPFTVDFQEFISRYAWGDIWSRPGLDAPTRRIIALSMVLALGREREFKIHLKAALEHGMDQDIVKELLLQSAIYCGVPTALDGFTMASEIIEQMNAEQD